MDQKTSLVQHRIDFVDGPFDMRSGRLACVGNRKYGHVSLCFRAGMNVSFAPIQLHSRDLASEADEVFDDAMRLGEEIARRWNRRALSAALVEAMATRLDGSPPVTEADESALQSLICDPVTPVAAVAALRRLLDNG